MDTATTPPLRLGTLPKSLGRRLLAIGENRLELLMLELKEDRERLLHALLLGLGLAVALLMCGITLTVAVAVFFWKDSPTVGLLVLMVFFVSTSAFLYARLHHLRQNWRTFPDTMDQLKKDRQCIDKLLH